MKTTIDIPDSLLEQARRLAAERGTTLKALIETGLREVLAHGRQSRRRVRLETHTFTGRGLQPGLSWDQLGAVIDLAYEGRGGRA